ncbi:PAS domain S-box protein [Gimesia chilikensis]|uniref:PAS domain S-box protein n=1 Tax=Gimesia chilikensis TaxID=2605989 RepID=UPI0011EDF117|nr:PAS domain S-box protein [Gimesia chilikensis]KAA0134995.1 PAS domain S-box protein [Gimesia chilikensis]
MSHATTSELLDEVTRLRRRVGELEQEYRRIDAGAKTPASRGPVGLPANRSDSTHSLLDALPCAVCECDLSGTILLANTTFAELHGYPQFELTNRHYADLVADERDRAAYRTALEQLGVGKISSHTQELVHCRQDGKRISLEVKWQCQRDASDAVTGLLAVVNEVRRTVTGGEQEIDLAGQYFRLVREMILVIDAEQKITLINPHGCRLLEAEESEILGVNWFDHFLPVSNREEVRTLFDQLMRGENRPVEFFENDIQTATGRVKRVAWHNSILRDDADNIIGTLSVGIDITERLEEQQALRESKQIFQQISEHVNEMLWVSSADLQKVYYISPKYEEFWGLTCQSAYDDATLWIERIHPDDRERLMQSMNRKIQGDFSETDFPQFRVVHPDGSFRWLEARSFPVYNEQQEVTRLVGVIDDITQRKRDEDAILKVNEELEERVRQRTSELAWKTAQFSALFENLPDKVLVINHDGEIVNFNGSHRERLFSDVDVSSGKKIWDLLPDEIRLPFTEAIQRVQAERKRESIDYPRTIEGQQHWYRARVQPYLQDEILIIIEDISEQKISEIELNKTHDKLSEAQRLAHIGSWEWDVTDDSLWWSEEVFRIFDLPSDTFRPTYPSFLKTIHPEDRGLLERVVEQSILNDLPYSIEHRIIRPDGEVRYVHERGAVKKDTRGNVISMHGTVQDITERYTAARKTQEYRDILAHASRLAIMGELTAGISHELNQPLTAMANYSSAMKTRIEQGLDVSDLVQRIEALSHRSGDIVRRLKSMAEKRPQELMRFNILDSIRSTLQLIEYELRQKQIDVQLVCESRMLVVYADRVQIEQVLSNLFLNAMDAMSEMPLSRRLTIEVAPAGEFMVRVTVSDTGPGVPDDFVGQLFTPFTTNKQGGLGIGLSLSRSLVEASGGKICYSPKSDSGASFDVFLPCRKMDE